jgi:hypothetical protein
VQNSHYDYELPFNVSGPFDHVSNSNATIL